MPVEVPPPEVLNAVAQVLGRGFWPAFVNAANAGLQRGTVTSWWRSATENARVGGDPNSQHLWALAFDGVGIDGAELRRQGFTVVNEIDHTHVQTFPKR